MERRIQEQQDRMKREFDEEQAKKKAKEQAVKQQKNHFHGNFHTILFIPEIKTSRGNGAKTAGNSKRSRKTEKRGS